MNDWFAVERLDEDTFAISEYGHWEETHSYLLLGSARALLIDTGLGVADLKAMVDSLTALPVTVVTTHAHWDHIGGHRSFDHILVHEAEREWLTGRFPLPLQVVKRNLTSQPCTFPPGFSLDDYEIFQGEPAGTFRDGDCFELGGRQITAVHTPGHSPGHCCFYEAARKTLYTGDLIYRGCLDTFYPTTDPVLFCRSVERVVELDVEQVRPGHHSLELTPELISRVEQAFHALKCRGALEQGNGIFDFGEFQIHI